VALTLLVAGFALASRAVVSPYALGIVGLAFVTQ
jgi:hypothetical protein